MKKLKFSPMIANILLVVAAVIWGYSFISQDEAGRYVGTFTINAVRFLIGSIVLIPIVLLNFRTPEKSKEFKTKIKPSLIGGGIAGFFLFVAVTIQQIGINGCNDPGKAGFITAMYIVLVPVFGIFLKKKLTAFAVVGICIAPVGLYLLCVKDGFSLATSDLLLLGCAVFFSLQIICIDIFSSKTDGVLFSIVEFLTTSVLSFPVAFITEKISVKIILDNISPILFLGVFSCGIAYTLQVIAQSKTNPTVASLLMSLESVFSVIFTAIFYEKTIETRELLGCIVIFSAVILAQIPTVKKEKVND
ncbi:MAG: DMT family transporter [Clostridia bacterium]|nr:DMT family transporter [Clostridia bacterium]